MLLEEIFIDFLDVKRIFDSATDIVTDHEFGEPSMPSLAAGILAGLLQQAKQRPHLAGHAGIAGNHALDRA